MAQEWELHDGTAQVGPLAEDHVVRMIAAGIPATTLVRPARSEKWISLRAHVPFAMALETRAATPAIATTTAAPGGSSTAQQTRLANIVAAVAPYVGALPKWAWLLSGSTIAVVVVLAALLGTASRGRPPEDSHASVWVPATPTTVATRSNPLDVIMKKRTMAEALAVAAPLMSIEKVDDSSPGTFLFALWSIENLRWSDAAPARDETSYAKARKDIDAERLKRLCVPGLVIQIEAFKQHNGTLYAGLLMNDAANLYHFNAVQSTGDLVQQSPARFCGVVTGKYDYSNSAGGEGHAIDMVGMFDLPQNKQAEAAPAARPQAAPGGRYVNRPTVVTTSTPASPAPPVPAPLPPSTTARPHAGNCGCAAGDMKCAMKCSAGQ